MVLQIVCFILALTAVAKGRKTTCTAPAVFKGETASITCFLPEDVSKSNRNFKMYHFSSDTASTKAVLDCYWPSRNNLACDTVAPGFKFNNTVSDQLTVTIPNVTQDFVGSYECQVEPADPNNIEDCEFKLKYGVKPVPTTTVKPTAHSETITEGSAEPSDSSGGAIAAVIIVLLLIILIVAGVLLCRFRRDRVRKIWSSFWNRCVETADGSTSPSGSPSSAERGEATTWNETKQLESKKIPSPDQQTESGKHPNEDEATEDAPLLSSSLKTGGVTSATKSNILSQGKAPENDWNKQKEESRISSVGSSPTEKNQPVKEIEIHAAEDHSSSSHPDMPPPSKDSDIEKQTEPLVANERPNPSQHSKSEGHSDDEPSENVPVQLAMTKVDGIPVPPAPRTSAVNDSSPGQGREPENRLNEEKEEDNINPVEPSSKESKPHAAEDNSSLREEEQQKIPVHDDKTRNSDDRETEKRGQRPVETEAKGPTPVDTETKGPTPVDTETKGPTPVDTETKGPTPVETEAKGPTPVDTETKGPTPVETEAKGPTPVDTETKGPTPGETETKGPTPVETAQTHVAEPTQPSRSPEGKESSSPTSPNLDDENKKMGSPSTAEVQPADENETLSTEAIPTSSPGDQPVIPVHDDRARKPGTVETETKDHDSVGSGQAHVTGPTQLRQASAQDESSSPKQVEEPLNNFDSKRENAPSLESRSTENEEPTKPPETSTTTVDDVTAPIQECASAPGTDDQANAERSSLGPDNLESGPSPGLSVQQGSAEQVLPEATSEGDSSAASDSEGSRNPTADSGENVEIQTNSTDSGRQKEQKNKEAFDKIILDLDSTGGRPSTEDAQSDNIETQTGGNGLLGASCSLESSSSEQTDQAKVETVKDKKDEQ